MRGESGSKLKWGTGDPEHLAGPVSIFSLGKGFLMMWLVLWPIKWLCQHFALSLAMRSIMFRCPLNQSLFVLTMHKA